MVIYRPRRLPGLFKSLLLAPIVFNFSATSTNGISGLAQEPFPDSPDLTRVYYQAPQNKLLPLPFEIGVSGLNEFAVARKDKTSHVTLEGLQAVTVLKMAIPDFTFSSLTRWIRRRTCCCNSNEGSPASIHSG